MAEDIPVTGPGGTTPPRGDYNANWRTGYPTGIGMAPAAAKRVSWGAIFAGAVVALVVELALGTLGLAVALGNINPATEPQGNYQGLGIGTGIWLVVTTLLALFAGGWTAARLAGLPRKTDAVLHGVVSWGLVTLFSAWMLTTFVGNVVSGAFGVVGSTLGIVGQGVTAMAPAVGEAVSGQLGGGGGNVGTEVRRFLEQTGDPQLRPEALQQRLDQAAEGAGTATTQPNGNAFDAIQAAFSRLATQGEAVVNEVDREDAINVLVARTDMNRAEAARTVDNWERQWNQVRSTLGETRQQVGETAAQVTEDVSGGLGSLMLWSFLAMVIGFCAAAFGGSLGAPQDLAVYPTTSAGVPKEH